MSTGGDDRSREPTDESVVPDRRSRWGLLVGASLMGIGLGAYELAPASVTPLILDSLGVTSSTAGLLVGVMFGTAVVASLPAGVVLDRTNSRTVSAVAVGLLLLAGAWGWQAARTGAFASLLASRVLGGVAYVVVWNAGIDIVGRSFPSSRQATAVAVFTTSGPLGFALGQATAPLVAAAYGWPAVFPVYTAITAAGLLVFWPASTGQGRAAGTTAPSPTEFAAVVTNRRIWTVGLIGFLAYSIYLFVNSWAPTYLTDQLGLSLAAAGALTAVFPAVGVLSRVTGGVLSDELFDGRRRPVILASFLVATPFVAAFTRLPTVAVVVAALLVVGFAIQLCLGLVFAYVRELVDPGVAATAVAFLTSVGLAGAFVAPIAGGALIDAVGYPTTFAVGGLLGALGVVLAWFAPEPDR